MTADVPRQRSLHTSYIITNSSLWSFLPSLIIILLTLRLQVHTTTSITFRIIIYLFIFLQKEFDVLVDFPQSSRKMICLETEQVLSTRLLETLSPDDLKSSSTKSGHVSLPTLFDPQPLNAPILWRLPSWQHLKWTMHALAPVFALNLDSIQSISNSVKIYCLWLKNPQARPSCVTPEYLEEFISVKMVLA